LAALPRIAKAVAIGAVGWFIARAVRLLLSNLLSATGVNKLGENFGLDPSQPGQSVSAISGSVAFVLILTPAATAALDALERPAIAGPAVAMLERFLNALPQVFTALVILPVGVVIGRFIAQLVTRLLTGIGFDRVVQWLGVMEPQGMVQDTPPSGEALSSQVVSGEPRHTPSEILGVITLGAVVLFAAVAASNVLNLPALTDIISGAMALHQIGVATMIVTLAFGLTLGSIAVAAAVAFGLGGGRWPVSSCALGWSRCAAAETSSPHRPGSLVFVE